MNSPSLYQARGIELPFWKVKTKFNVGLDHILVNAHNWMEKGKSRNELEIWKLLDRYWLLQLAGKVDVKIDYWNNNIKSFLRFSS